MLIPIVGSAYAERSLNLDAQTCINLYEVTDPTGKFSTALYNTPGMTEFADLDGYSVRALYQTNGLLFAVVDHYFYQILPSGTKIQRGTLNTSKGRVSIISNGLQLMLVDGVYGYYYTFETKFLQQITDEDFEPPILVTYQDGYGIFAQQNTNRWWLTDLFDFSGIDAISFAAANGTPDNLVSAISLNQEVWLFSRDTTEIWFNTGDANFTFQRRQTLLIEYGCKAPFSVVKVGNQLFWLSANRQGELLVLMTEGYAPKVISTPPITQILQGLEDVSDAFSISYQMDNYTFVVLTFPKADKSLQYNVTTGRWNVISSTLTNSIPRVLPTRQGRWRANCHAVFDDKQLVGDFESGKIFELKPDVFTENGTYILRERTGLHLHGELYRIPINQLQIDVETGVGVVDGQGEDPQLMLQISRDNGHSWGIEKWRSIGPLGYYKKRLLFHRLGAARDWVFRIRTTDPVKSVVLGARADAMKGAT